jgi:DNA-binding ferritin-like protein
LLLAEQADQVLVTIDTIGGRVRALGGTPIRLIDEVAAWASHRQQTIEARQRTSGVMSSRGDR